MNKLLVSMLMVAALAAAAWGDGYRNTVLGDVAEDPFVATTGTITIAEDGGVYDPKILIAISRATLLDRPCKEQS